jgi:hypothetical protein
MKKNLLAVMLLSSASMGVFAQSTPVNLKTQTGNEIGLTVSSYSYSEPSLNVSMKATNWGVDYTGTYAFGNDFFVLGNANYNNGQVNYSGTGTQSGIPQYYYDFKGVVGYDFAFEDFVLSPYAGIGYRFLSQQNKRRIYVFLLNIILDFQLKNLRFESVDLKFLSLRVFEYLMRQSVCCAQSMTTNNPNHLRVEKCPMSAWGHLLGVIQF